MTSPSSLCVTSCSRSALDVRDGRDRRFRLSLREVLASGRVRVIPDGPGRSRPVLGRAARDGVGDPGQLTAEGLKEVGERAADVNEVLSGYRAGSEETGRAGRGIVLDRDAIEGPMADAAREAGLASPALVPETLVIDHGKVYVSEDITSVCQRMGSSIQPVRLRTGRDKGIPRSRR